MTYCEWIHVVYCQTELLSITDAECSRSFRFIVFSKHFSKLFENVTQILMTIASIAQTFMCLKAKSVSIDMLLYFFNSCAFFSIKFNAFLQRVWWNVQAVSCSFSFHVFFLRSNKSKELRNASDLEKLQFYSRLEKRFIRFG